MRRFDPTETPRREHYAWFRRMDHPWLAVTAEVDVSGILAQSQTIGRFAIMAHALSAAAQSIPELRQRIRVEGGQDVVVEHSVVHPGLTLAGEGDLFAYAAVPYDPSLEAFAVAMDVARANVGDGLQPLEHDRDDLLFLTCLPWVRFTQVDHAMGHNSADAIPRIAWGRLSERDGRWWCPVSLQAHHALVDGVHVGRFFQALEQMG